MVFNLRQNINCILLHEKKNNSKSTEKLPSTIGLAGRVIKKLFKNTITIIVFCLRHIFLRFTFIHVTHTFVAGTTKAYLSTKDIAFTLKNELNGFYYTQKLLFRIRNGTSKRKIQY